MEQLVKVATCTLNQWAMDFDGNVERTRKSIDIAKNEGARYRVGPELEISGYGCEDHFLEADTIFHSWEAIAALLSDDLTDGIVCDVGAPVRHNDCLYNCRVFLWNRKIVCIRPKMYLANDGNYREPRWFTRWKSDRKIEKHVLPVFIEEITGQTSVPFGNVIIQTRDAAIGHECCEELFAPNSPHIRLGLLGVEIIGNGSGSHHQLRKLHQRIGLLRSATSKGGGVYLYANQIGCDGGRLYYDGSALIACNGQILQQAPQFSLREVEVLTAVVNLDDVRSARTYHSSRCEQASEAEDIHRVWIDFRMVSGDYSLRPSNARHVRYHTAEEEIAYGPACWLWDYLRRSRTAGFFLPLSGGADSAATAAIVGSMCQLVVKFCAAGEKTVLDDARRLAGVSDPSDPYIPTDAREFANRIFHTCYLGTQNSSAETKDRARRLADEIGAFHMSVVIDVVIAAIINVFVGFAKMTPRFKVQGGGQHENLALQNIQARVRMVLSYLFAQLLMWVRGRGTGSLLVLGSANVDEGLRGYLTKYDCSSADINPIGGISKADIRRFLVWGSQHLNYPALLDVEQAPPTAELEPITAEYVQIDEVDMGMTYAELTRFGNLRKVERCGPLSMFEKLCREWDELPPREVSAKVKRFFWYYSVNRHKMTTLTPSYHAENYSPEDNRYDLRQFLYNTRWAAQFRAIDNAVEKMEQSGCCKNSRPCETTNSPFQAICSYRGTDNTGEGLTVEPKGVLDSQTKKVVSAKKGDSVTRITAGTDDSSSCEETAGSGIMTRGEKKGSIQSKGMGECEGEGENGPKKANSHTRRKRNAGNRKKG